MAEMVKINIRGLREIHRAMDELPRRANRSMLNEGLLEGARLVRDEARAKAPVLADPDPRRRPGTLRRAIRAGRVRPQPGTAATVWVRIRSLTRRQIARFKKKNGASGAENPNDPFYWRFVEFGTSKMAARPFMRPAFEAKKEPAVRRAVEIFRDRVQAAIKKLYREPR